MPPWSVRLVRAGLCYLALGFLLGAALLVRKAGWPLAGDLPLLPLHLEAVLTGWFVQTTMGVAYWILPRYPTRPERGSSWPVAGAFWIVNLGIGLTVAGAAWPRLSPAMFPGRLAEALAVLLFGLHTWSRIRPTFAPPAPGPIRPASGR